MSSGKKQIKMKTNSIRKTVYSIRKTVLSLIIFSVTILLFNCKGNTKKVDVTQTELDSLRSQVSKMISSNSVIAKNLKTFDELDFVIYSNQEWKRFHESHSKDILVHYPDGHTTKGLEAHIKELEPMFVFAPDTRIEEHPIKLGSGNMTAVVGELLGTFTKPMPIGNGKFIQPTGKSFKLPMCTVGLWNEDGVMYEEFLFWDNQAFLKQIGIAQ